MDILARVAKQKIQAAIARGEADNLSLQGQPIRQEDDRMVPEELRMGYRILKNAGVLPEELQLKKELLVLQDLLNCCQQPEGKEQLQKRLGAKQLRHQLLMERRPATGPYGQYRDKLPR